MISRATATLPLLTLLFLFLVLSVIAPSLAEASNGHGNRFRSPDDFHRNRGENLKIQLGPRPYFLVNDMAPGRLKARL